MGWDTLLAHVVKAGKQGKCSSQGAGALVWCFGIIPAQSPSSLQSSAPCWCCSSSGWGSAGPVAEKRFEFCICVLVMDRGLFSEKQWWQCSLRGPQNRSASAPFLTGVTWNWLLCHLWVRVLWPHTACPCRRCFQLVLSHSQELCVPLDKVTVPSSNLATSPPWMCSDSRHGSWACHWLISVIISSEQT